MTYNNINRLFFSLLLLVISNISFAQVGINTEKPTADLDINGNLIIRTGILKTGDTQTAGIRGQVLQSQGPNNPPKWATTVGTKRGSGYSLYGSFSENDSVGVILTKQDEVGLELYPENTPFAGWTLIGELTQKITLKPLDPTQPNALRENVLVVNFETVVQTNNWTEHYGYYVAYAIGIFVDGQLKGTTVDEIFFANGTAMTYSKTTTVAVVKNIATGDHTIEVAAKRRYSNIPSDVDDVSIAVGIKTQDSRAQNTNNFMNQSIFSGDLYLK